MFPSHDRFVRSFRNEDRFAPGWIRYFKVIENVLDDQELVNEIRVKIIKQEDSPSDSYIKDLFGLDGYSLNDFENLIDQEIKDRIDEGKDYLGRDLTTENLNTIRSAGAEYVFTYDPDAWWGGTVDIAAEKVVSAGANELVTYLGTTSVTYDAEQLEAVKKTRVYQNGTNYGKEAISVLLDLRR